jgi:hypothetical protein
MDFSRVAWFEKTKKTKFVRCDRKIDHNYNKNLSFLKQFGQPYFKQPKIVLSKQNKLSFENKQS